MRRLLYLGPHGRHFVLLSASSSLLLNDLNNSLSRDIKVISPLFEDKVFHIYTDVKMSHLIYARVLKNPEV